MIGLFVYGTLMPGHLRWHLLAPHAVHCRPATVAGRLFDTGEGWPAASFATAEDPETGVPGWIVELPDDRSAPLLALLDGVETGFERVRVTTLDGDETWSYEVAEPDPGWRPIVRWTAGAER